jgi:hypothetical protein
LWHRHIDETVWLIASGSSMNYIRKDFFRDKLTVVVNEAHRDWPTQYMLAHHRECCQEAIDKGLTVVASEYSRCDYADGLNVFHGDWYQ